MCYRAGFHRATMWPPINMDNRPHYLIHLHNLLSLHIYIIISPQCFQKNFLSDASFLTVDFGKVLNSERKASVHIINNNRNKYESSSHLGVSVPGTVQRALNSFQLSYKVGTNYPHPPTGKYNEARGIAQVASRAGIQSQAVSPVLLSNFPHIHMNENSCYQSLS